MDLVTYALEIDYFDEAFYLLKREGCSTNYYKSPLQEPNTIDIETNIFFTAIRKKQVEFLKELLIKYGSIAYREERAIVGHANYSYCCNLLGLALLSEYANIDVIRVLLNYKFKPEFRGYKNSKDERFKKVIDLTSVQQAIILDDIEIIRLLITHGAPHSILRHYIQVQNLEGVRMACACEHITWNDVEFALSLGVNEIGEQIFQLVYERFNIQK